MTYYDPRARGNETHVYRLWLHRTMDSSYLVAAIDRASTNERFVLAKSATRLLLTFDSGQPGSMPRIDIVVPRWLAERNGIPPERYALRPYGATAAAADDSFEVIES